MLRIFTLILSAAAHLALFVWLLSLMGIVDIFDVDSNNEQASATIESQPQGEQIVTQVDLTELPSLKVPKTIDTLELQQKADALAAQKKAQQKARLRREQERQRKLKQSQEKKKQAQKKQQKSLAKKKEQAKPIANTKEPSKQVKKVAKKTTAKAVAKAPQRTLIQTRVKDEATQRDIEAVAIISMRKLMPDISSLVLSNWRRPAGYNSGLGCIVEVSVNQKGKVLSTRVVDSSGNLLFDRSVEVAIHKSSPLPIPSDPEYYAYLKKFNFRFIPES